MHQMYNYRTPFLTFFLFVCFEKTPKAFESLIRHLKKWLLLLLIHLTQETVCAMLAFMYFVYLKRFIMSLPVCWNFTTCHIIAVIGYIKCKLFLCSTLLGAVQNANFFANYITLHLQGLEWVSKSHYFLTVITEVHTLSKSDF